MTSRRAPFAVAALLLLAVGCGTDHHEASSPSAAPRTVAVTMVDSRFEPAAITVRRGEKVTFQFTNRGSVLHEAFFGDEAEQDAHASTMTSMAMGDDTGGMDHHHSMALRVEPGATEIVTETFDDAGAVIIGCHQPGHYEAGMKATVTVG